MKLFFAVMVSPLLASAEEFARFEMCEGVIMHDNTELGDNQHSGITAFTVISRVDSQEYTFYEVYKEGDPVAYGFLDGPFDYGLIAQDKTESHALNPADQIYELREGFLGEHGFYPIGIIGIDCTGAAIS